MNLARLVAIVTVLLRHGCGYLLAMLPRRVCPKPIPAPERLRMLFEELGGAFIKFGQMLALQPDLLSLEYCNALFNLLDRVPPFGFDEVESIFVEELGRRPSEIFERFDPNPLATASIGQVHLAWLDGRKLAVKVQRPTARQAFAGDMRLMTAAINLIKTLHLRACHWMIEPMSEFVAWTREELDYRHEARYMHRLRQNARGNPHECVPEVLDEFTTGRVLVMEFLEGHTVLAYLRALERGDESLIEELERARFDSHEVASHIIDNFLGDVFQHGLFHADLHPANLMILPDNAVGYIDFGITGTISSYSRQNLVALTLAYTRGDLDAMCESFLRVSASDSPSSVLRFREGLARDAVTWYANEGRHRRLRKNFTLVMLDMLHLSHETGVWPERDVIKYIRSAIAIDGLITRFAPTFDLGGHLASVCDRHLKWQQRRRLLTLNNLLGWTSASGHLLRDGGVRAFHALGRMAAGQMAGRATTERGSSTIASKTMYFAAFLFTSCLAAALSPEPPRLGINLFTAEVLVAANALILLIGNLRKFPKGG